MNGFVFHHQKNIFTPATVGAPHYHKNFEIYFITAGECTYFINNRVYELKAGDIILIPDGVIHNTSYRDTNYSRMLINCSQRYIPASVYGYLPELVFLYRNPAVVQEVKDIFNEIEREYSAPDDISEDVLTCHTHRLFFLLTRNRNTCIRTEAKNQTIQKSIYYMQTHFALPITLADAAKNVSVSPEHFSRMFKKETGFGFNKYLNLLRLQKAEKMLTENPDLTVTEISHRCGFCDSNYFSVKFKEFYKTTPKKLQHKYCNLNRDM